MIPLDQPQTRENPFKPGFSLRSRNRQNSPIIRVWINHNQYHWACIFSDNKKIVFCNSGILISAIVYFCNSHSCFLQLNICFCAIKPLFPTIGALYEILEQNWYQIGTTNQLILQSLALWYASWDIESKSS